jgi:PAS domain S-box-containing protein
VAVREGLSEASILKAEVAALNALLTVQEKVVIDQSMKLAQAVHVARAAQKRWQSTFDAIEDLVVVVDKDHRIQAANKAARNSVPGQEIVGMHCYEVFHRTSAPRPECPFEESARTGKPAHGEWSEPHFKGCWFNVSTFPIPEEDGSPGQFVHIVRDVSDRRLAEERFRLLFESSRDAIMTGAPPSGGFTSANPATLAMFRAKTEAEFLLHGPADLSPERQSDGRLSAEKAPAMIEKAMREGTHFFEWMHKRFDGEEFPASVLLTRVEQAGKAFILATVRDITEQKRAEDALRASEAQLSNALQMGRAGNWEYDVASDMFKFSDNFYRIFGTTAKQVGGYQMRSADYARKFCHPDDAFVVRKEIQAAIENTDPAYSRQIERRILCADGTIGHMTVRLFTVKDGKGRTIRAYGVHQDITERKRTENELRRSEAQLSNALQMAQAGHWEYDVATDLFTFNDNFYRIFHTTAEQVGGYLMRSADYARRFCHPDDAPLVRAGIKTAIETTDPAYSPQLEHRILNADGTIGQVAVRFSIVKDRQGRTISWYGVNQDITERKRKEEALLASQQIIEGIINTAPVRIFWKDKNLVFLGCNAAFARDAGFDDPKDVIGKDDYQMGWHDQADLYRAGDIQVFKSGCSKLLVEEPQTTPEGNAVTLLTSKVPLRSSTGEIMGVLGTYMDISDRKRAEEALKAKTADLERANEEVKQFAYIVSHDFRAPLVNLKGFAGEIRTSLSAVAAAMESAGPHLSEEQQKAATAAIQTDVPEALHFIEAAASNMDNYINALLKLSRLGRQELHLERLNVAEIVERSLKGLAHQIGERSVTVSVGPLPEVVADRTALEQIMGNILTNAVLYLQPGRPGRIEVGGSRGTDETSIFVRDNGRGVAPEDIPKVFALFRRAGKQDVKGEGMGLAYVRTLVRRHGGEIRCESQVGVGTTFTFTLRNSIEKELHDAHTPTDRA